MDEVDILLVEDNPGDVALIKQAFEERELPGTVHDVRTGDKAIDWLYQCDEFVEVPRPDLVLLDLNLSSTGGHVVLDEIESDPQLKPTPVIVLTGSDSEPELLNTYKEGANACLIKPVDPDEFADLIQTFADFWISTATLPPVSDSADAPPL